MSTRFDAVDSCVLGLGLLGEWSIKPSPGMVLALNRKLNLDVTTLSQTSDTSSHLNEDGACDRPLCAVLVCDVTAKSLGIDRVWAYIEYVVSEEIPR